MNNERFRARGRLLNDVLSDEAENQGGQKAFAMAAFRRARLQRRVRGYGGLILIAAAALTVIFHFARIERTELVAMKISEPQAQVGSENSEPLLKLTDEELIACFPSNSCFLAEVNGRQVLVFTERSLREKFLEKTREP